MKPACDRSCFSPALSLLYFEERHLDREDLCIECWHLIWAFLIAGEVAVHLLSRLLAFDPERRCTAEEALQHEFFSGLESGDDAEAGESETFTSCITYTWVSILMHADEDLQLQLLEMPG